MVGGGVLDPTSEAAACAGMACQQGLRAVNTQPSHWQLVYTTSLFSPVGNKRAKATTGTTLATRIKSAWAPLTASRRCPLVECEAFNNMQASLVAHLMRHMRPCYPNPSGLPSLLLRVPSTALAAQAASDAAAQPLPSQLQLQAPRPPPTPVDLPLACPLCPHGPARPAQGVAAAIMVTHEREVVEQAAALAQLLWVRQQSGQSLSPVAALNPKPVGSPKAGGVAPSQPNSRALAAHLIAYHPHLLLLAAALAKGIALHRRDGTGPEPAHACCHGCGLLLPCSSSAAAAHLMQAHAAQVQQLYFALGSITSLAALSASGGEAAAGQRVGGGCVCPLHCGRWLADDGLSALLHMATAHTRYVWKMAELALQRAGSDGAMSPRRLVDLPRVVPGAMPHAAATPSPVLAQDFLAMVHLKVPAPPSPPRIPAPRGVTGTGRAARQVDDRLALNGASPPSAEKQHRQKVHPPKQHALAGGQEVHPAVQQLQPPLEEDVPVAPGMSREVELAAPPSLAQRARSPPAYRPPVAPASAAAVRSPRSQGGPTASPTPKVQLVAPFSAPHSGAAGTTAEPVAREQRAQGYGEPSQVWTPTAPNCQPPSGHPGLPEDVVLMGTVEALTLPTLPPEALHAVVPSATTLDPVAGLTAGPTSPSLPLPSGTPLAPHSPQGPMLPSSAASLSQTPSWSAPSPSHTALPHPLPGIALAETQPQQPLTTPPSPLHPQPQQPPPAAACALTQSDPSHITQPPAVQSSRPPSPVPAPLPPQPSAPLPPPPSSAQGATSTTNMLYQDPSLGGVPVGSPLTEPAPQGPPPTHPSPRHQPASPLQPPTSPAPPTPPPDLATVLPCATSPASASAPSTSPSPPPLAHPDTPSPAPAAPATALPATAGVVEDRMAPHQLLLSALGAGSTHTLAQPAPLQPASPAQATFTASQAASSTLPLPGPPHHPPTALPLPTPQQQQSTPPAAREGPLPPKPSGTVHAVQLPSSSSSGAEDGDVVLLGTVGMVAMPTLPAELLSLVSTPAPPSGKTGAEVAAPAPAAVAASEPPPGAAAAGPPQQGPTAAQGRVRETAGPEAPSPPTHPVGSRPPTSPTNPASPVSETSPASSTSPTSPASPLHGTTQDHPTSERQQPPSTQQAAGDHAPGAASGAHPHAPTGKAAAATQESVEAAKGASSAPVASTVVGLRGGAGAAAGAGLAAGVKDRVHAEKDMMGTAMQLQSQA
ncbi:hypothetical protein QJQ45_009917 [Haematococcus lacustris]|nr:hypothetical protein QJQ45_009917 [Haematococcus lacustris]